jgi:hypothetical protein
MLTQSRVDHPRKTARLLATTGLVFLVMLFVAGLPASKEIILKGIGTSSPRAAMIPAPLLWNTTWGGTKADECYSVWGDGTRLYTAGSTKSYGPDNYNFALAAWNPVTGAKLWNTTWGGIENDPCYSVWGDGTRVYTAGETCSFGDFYGDMALVAWDPATGTKLWNATWGGGSDTDIAYSVWGDGTRIYTAGYTNSFGPSSDFALVAWDPANGAILWESVWSMWHIDVATSVWGDGIQIYTAGYTQSYSASGLIKDFALVAWDPATGVKLWNTTWGGPLNDEGTSVWGDGTRVYTTGYTASYGAGDADFALVAWNPVTGAKLWNTTWGGKYNDKGYSVWGDGTRVYTTGYTASFSPGFYYDLALVAWDPEMGSFLWSDLWGGVNYEEARGIWGDGTRLFTAGWTWTFTAGENDFALVAWDVHFSVSHPNDFTYAASTTGHSFTWVVSCAITPTGSYIIYRDGVAFTSGTWTSDQDIVISVDNLALGAHAFTLVATDGYGGQVTDTIDVAVIAPTPELWSIPEILMIAMLGLIFVAVLLRARPASPGARTRDVSPALVDSKGPGKPSNQEANQRRRQKRQSDRR